MRGDAAHVAEFMARFFLRFQRKAAFLLVAFTAANLKAAMTALFGQLEAGRQRERRPRARHVDGRLARVGQIFTHGGQGNP